jgi:hypothetical protein
MLPEEWWDNFEDIDVKCVLCDEHFPLDESFEGWELDDVLLGIKLGIIACCNCSKWGIWVPHEGGWLDQNSYFGVVPIEVIERVCGFSTNYRALKSENITEAADTMFIHHERHILHNYQMNYWRKLKNLGLVFYYDVKLKTNPLIGVIPWAPEFLAVLAPKTIGEETLAEFRETLVPRTNNNTGITCRDCIHRHSCRDAGELSPCTDFEGE